MNHKQNLKECMFLSVVQQPTVTFLPVVSEKNDKCVQLHVAKQKNRVTKAILFQMSDNSLSHKKAPVYLPPLAAVV